MADEPLTNAASERARQGVDVINAEGWAALIDVEEQFTEDFVFDDRRSTINFGRHEGPEPWLRTVEATWQLSGTRPQWTMSEVIAVRGERTAAFAVLLDYGNAMEEETIQVVHYQDADMRCHRLLLFDPDDRNAAIAEVERLHAESGE